MSRVNKDKGQTYGTWYVRDVISIDTHTMCQCVCLQCGTSKDIRQDILHKTPPQCACSKEYADYTGRVFGYLKVNEKIDDDNYLCECVCGNIITVSAHDIRFRVKISCGCKKSGAMLKERICQQCGKKFEGGPRAWYCPDCRAERAKESKKRTAERRKNGTIAIIGGKMICEMCGKECIRNCANQRFCYDCGKINDQNVDREQSLKYYRDNKEIINPRRNELRRQKYPTDINESEETTETVSENKKSEIGICEVCGKEFVKKSHLQKYCSDECKAIKKKEQHRISSKKYYESHKPEKADYYPFKELFDKFSNEFPKTFISELQKNNITSRDISNKLGIYDKTVYSWKYGEIPSIDKLIDLYKMFGPEILPGITEYGTLEKKEPITPINDSFITQISASYGYKTSDIAKMLNIDQGHLLLLYKNKNCKAKTTFNTLYLFGYKTVSDFLYLLDDK